MIMYSSIPIPRSPEESTFQEWKQARSYSRVLLQSSSPYWSIYCYMCCCPNNSPITHPIRLEFQNALDSLP